MTEQLANALAEARRLNEQDQIDLAELVRAFVAARTTEPYTPSEEEEAAIEEGLSQAQRGEFISEAAADALLRRPWG